MTVEARRAEERGGTFDRHSSLVQGPSAGQHSALCLGVVVIGDACAPKALVPASAQIGEGEVGAK